MSQAPPSKAAPAAVDTPQHRILLDDAGVRRSLVRIAHEIVERNDAANDLYVVAIPNGGVPLGRSIVAALEGISGVAPPRGILDTTLYRDDLTTSGERPLLRETEMPSSVDGRIGVLVEDVVNTGRTIRAAMDALMDFGRPRIVQVVALIDRGHRELPIKIDYVGKNIPTHPADRVRLIADSLGQEPMKVVLEELAGGESAPLQEGSR